MDQNVDLIREINDLKRERKFLNDEKQREKLMKSRQNSNLEYLKLTQEIEDLGIERSNMQK